MPDISIRIVADPSGAKQGLQDVQKDLQKLGATMKDVMKVSAKGFRPFGNETNASKDLEKYSLRIKAMTNATNTFVSGLKRPEDQLKAWRSQLSFFQKEYMELLTQGKFSFDGDDRLGNQMLGNIEETEKRIAEIKKSMEQEKALSRKAREGAEAEQVYSKLGTVFEAFSCSFVSFFMETTSASIFFLRSSEALPSRCFSTRRALSTLRCFSISAVTF